MSIDTTYATAATGYGAASTTSASNDTLDQQAFLELLVAQLRNQDPSSPMDSSQLMAQTTQLATMERLVEISDTSRESFALQMRVAGASLVGQTVSWTDADGTVQTGVVDAVSYAGAVPTVTVGGEEIPLDQVGTVTRTGAITTPDPVDSTPDETTPDDES
ncbi:flagellar hook capping protein [Cellulomonas sp. DKR-3]|uniref:Flagellar hook capping protein n=1 Tax=Cellulomonas fulva TaxID=2835530 RepID=A0ABS5TVE0_9CELL|nr:flagellar hook capping FlgD N-terminal domain-containing protein [Cellulomonas fulva]MBT0993072.1 flagellar hook capping protein [Cellulomonas fulva]